jgi:hypothetical protein
MLLQETMRQVTSPIPSNVLVQNGYQPNSMDNWLARRPVLLPAWNGPEEPSIQQQLRSAFKAQAKIGWVG